MDLGIEFKHIYCLRLFWNLAIVAYCLIGIF